MAIQRVEITQTFEVGKPDTAKVRVTYTDGSMDEEKGVQAVQNAEGWLQKMKTDPIGDNSEVVIIDKP